MANEIETGSKNIKPWINLNHNTYISAIQFDFVKAKKQKENFLVMVVWAWRRLLNVSDSETSYFKVSS